jgi:hypothetical protein
MKNIFFELVAVDIGLLNRVSYLCGNINKLVDVCPNS